MIPLQYVHAVMAQLVEHWLPKPRVAGSSPVYRSRMINFFITKFSSIHNATWKDALGDVSFSLFMAG